jgi:rod shape-determining protein MreC
VAFPRRSSRTPRSRFTLGLLLLTAVTLLVLDLPGTGPLDPVRSALASMFRPVRSAGDTVFGPVRNGWKGAFGYDDVKDENARLRRRLAEVKSERARLDQLEKQVAGLNQLFGFGSGDVKAKNAQVTSGPLTSFDHSIQIDIGSRDGIKKGMVVISGGVDESDKGGQVLGRVINTTDHSSTVELITEPDFAVGVKLESGDKGTAQGRGRGKDLVADGIEGTTKVKRGDIVDTSGLDRSAFPKDLEVGRVTKVNRSADGDTKTIEIRPTADLNSTYVKVVLREATG